MIISAAICEKSGDILVARQCSHITKHSLEESMRNFPQLIQADQQHTFVETEYVRYVYLPLEEMFLVLLTKKTSNIIEDQETIRLLHKIVQDMCSNSGISQESILDRDFDILLAFDDVISQGMRESVSLSQVQSALSMESEDERLHIILMKQKQAEQDEAMKRHQQEMEQRRKAGKAAGNSNSISSSSYGSMGSGSYGGVGSSSGNTSMGSAGSSSTLKPSAYSDDNEGVYQSTEKPVYKNPGKATTIAPKSGMVLGKKAKIATQKEAQAALKVEVAASLKAAATSEPSSGSTNDGGNAKAINPLKAPVEVEIIEKMSASVERDGTVKSMDVNGEIFLLFLDASKSKVALQFEHENLKMNTMKPHINLNKQLWTDKKQIALKNIEQGFPVNTRIPSVKYRYASADPSTDVPFTITCWFNEGTIAIEVEFNSAQRRIESLSQLTFTFRYPNKESPKVGSLENATYETEAGCLRYIVPNLSSEESSSTIEITFSKNLTEDDVFPVNVDFELPNTFFEIQPLMVANLAEGNQLLKFDLSKKCVADKYQIV